MAVEGLDGQSCPHVPDRGSLVGGAGYEEIGEGLEVQAVYRVRVAPELLTHFQRVQIKELDCTIA